MVLIDINSNIGHWPFKKLKYNTCGTLLERMNMFGTDVSVVRNLNGIFYKNTQSANEELFDEIKSDKRFADRFIPFAILNPIYAGWKNDLEICVSKMGMKGICLYPPYHDYKITDPACVELVKRARDHGMIITFTHRIVDSRQRSWMDISDEWSLRDIMPVIYEVPDAKYFIVNAANSITVDNENMALLKKTDILFDTSGRALNNLAGMIKAYGKDKFAFGTHSPVLDYLSGLLRIESLDADEVTLQLLRSGNAKRMLDL
jgi:uncharacterized protein